MASKRHDNGVVDAPNKKKKNSKLDVAMRDLSEANSSKTQLAEELAKARETIRSLQTSLSSTRSECGEVNSIEFENDLGPCSTKRQSGSRSDSSVEISRFVSSMNQISVSSISIPECKPSVEGEDISRPDFEAWQDLLSNSMTLAGITDETTQYVVFKVKAGQKLLEIYRGTESSGDAPSVVTHPYSNAVFRLKVYFASTSDTMLQRRKLALMTQKANESDLAFIRRVGLSAKLCDYADEKQFEETLSTVAGQAKHKEVRIAALKMMSRKGSLSDLIDKVREIETIRLNEEYVSKKQVVTETTVASLNAVRTAAGPSRYGGSHMTPAYGRTPNQRFNLRGGRGQRPFRGGITWRGSSSQVPERCTRCNSIYHSSERCFAIQMTCHNCGGMGHLLRACKLPNFCEFWQGKSVRVRKSIPMCPQSNGLVERHNQAVIKTLSAAKIEGRNWRKALESFVHNHNTLIPHSRLNVTPFELLVGWKFRGTFPSLWSEVGGKELDRVNVREKDAEEKLISTKHADRVRGARPSEIRIGDTVFLKQQKKSKTDPTFSSERYTVVAQEGSKMVISSGNGVQYARSVNDLKKDPYFASSCNAATLDHDDDTGSDHSVVERDLESVKRDSRRQRKNVKRPARFNNDFIYRIFH